MPRAVHAVVVLLERVVFVERCPVGPLHLDVVFHLLQFGRRAYGDKGLNPEIFLSRDRVGKQQFDFGRVDVHANFFSGFTRGRLCQGLPRVLFAARKSVDGAAPARADGEQGLVGVQQHEAGGLRHVGELGWYGQIGVHACIVTGPPEGGHGGRAVCLSGRSDGC